MANTAQYTYLATLRRSMGPRAIVTTHQPRRYVFAKAAYARREDCTA